MSHLPLSDRVFVLTCYANSLFHGQSLLFSQTLRVKTVKRYLQAAASLATQRNMVDPRYGTQLVLPQQPMLQPLKRFLDRKQKWETLPNRSEPLTTQMADFCRQQAQTLPSTHLVAALADWFEAGLVTGFRISEYGQPKASATFQQAPNGEPLALTLEDLEFFTASGTLLPHYGALHHTAFVRVCWRYQKNGDNGERKTFARSLHRCPVAAFIRIVQRALLLSVPLNHPVAVYLTPTHDVRRITAAQVTTQLRVCARGAHNITSKQALSRFTTHSIRVGACLLLFMASHTAEFIKKRLRWRSNTFIDYYRDHPCLALMHAQTAGSTHIHYPLLPNNT